MRDDVRNLQRTKQYLERHGYRVGIVERTTPTGGDLQRRQRRDLYGIADLIAFIPGSSITSLIQVCTVADAKKHMDVLNNDDSKRQGALDWLNNHYTTHRQFYLYAWLKRMEPTKKGGRRARWHPRLWQVIPIHPRDESPFLDFRKYGH